MNYNRILYIYESQVDKLKTHGMCVGMCSNKAVFCYLFDDYIKNYRNIFDGVWRVGLFPQALREAPLHFNNAGRQELWKIEIVKEK